MKQEVCKYPSPQSIKIVVIFIFFLVSCMLACKKKEEAKTESPTSNPPPMTATEQALAGQWYAKRDVNYMQLGVDSLGQPIYIFQNLAIWGSSCPINLMSSYATTTGDSMFKGKGRFAMCYPDSNFKWQAKTADTLQIDTVFMKILFLAGDSLVLERKNPPFNKHIYQYKRTF